jgi:tRNA(Arg) A34 adenosine deaminase TadA
MRRAIELARESVRRGGGPFGCVVLRDDSLVAEGSNRVTAWNDPTAHAEIVAIREACRRLGAFQLERCTIFASCEPCPMCLGAIYWARPARLVFASTRSDAAKAGFDDDHVYRELALDLPRRSLRTETLLRDEALAAFDDWRADANRRAY